ncbi:YqaJ viral recombinase family protein [Streptomyces sp. NBC_00237]|uniref:YqaJ viral recombinase family nuclease n=1 Tax=Streptomyces sp. NBC_00237 TaxID=2975687 RepID=UPI002256F1E5|nr:YqaJ viral recombinase family protein [Streptomyces sp. NBC_00237]MCX5202419.1 YqaJ viral recombinase family protein [Streptomyces sp. NBC_00237]
MSTLTTPTGVLLGEFTPGTLEWDQARAGLTITATEIAAVMGLSPWQSLFSLWHKKAGLSTPPFEMTPAIEWGNRLEDAVAQKWVDEHQNTTEATQAGTWHHRDRDWQRATPDRIFMPLTGWEIAPGELPRLLEVKTSPFGDGWGPAGTDEIPLHYQCQIQWQLDTLGLQVCHVAVLISGHDYREYVVEYDPDDAKLMRTAAEEFLNSVRNGERPPIDGADATYQTIRVQHEGREDADVEISDQIAADYEIAQLGYKAAETELTRARGHVLDAIGTGYRAVHDGRRIAYRTVREDGTTLALQPYRSH